MGRRDMATDPNCVFCKIIKGEIPCHAVYREARVLAFLDVGPLAPGHVLLVPTEHVVTMDEASPEMAAALGAALPKLTRAVRETTASTGVNVLQNNGRSAGQEVQHLHIHIIPRKEGDGLGYRWNASKYAEGEAESIRQKLERALGK
jgi:histidine triad (HIT) family protein